MQAPTHDLGDQGASCVALYELAQLGGATMGGGHGLWLVCWECSEQGERTAHQLPRLRTSGVKPLHGTLISLDEADPCLASITFHNLSDRMLCLKTRFSLKYQPHDAEKSLFGDQFFALDLNTNQMQY